MFAGDGEAIREPMLDWRMKQQAKTAVQVTIDDILDMKG